NHPFLAKKPLALKKFGGGAHPPNPPEAMFVALADQLSAAPIQHIGKLFVLWRPRAEKERTVDEDRMAGPRDVKVLKYSSRGGQRPEVKTLRVLGNQRLTSGGQVKRAKPKKISVKKRSLG
ncbi:MAG: hypothetical protein ACOVKR_11570, partial [Limnohabitans sp.]